MLQMLQIEKSQAIEKTGYTLHGMLKIKNKKTEI